MTESDKQTIQRIKARLKYTVQSKKQLIMDISDAIRIVDSQALEIETLKSKAHESYLANIKGDICSDGFGRRPGHSDPGDMY
jgi:D-serine dehydratase